MRDGKWQAADITVMTADQFMNHVDITEDAANALRCKFRRDEQTRLAGARCVRCPGCGYDVDPGTLRVDSACATTDGCVIRGLKLGLPPVSP